MIFFDYSIQKQIKFTRISHLDPKQSIYVIIPSYSLLATD
jgi:hypothetical protein